MPEDRSFNFLKDYLAITRKEIDLEKTEHTRLLHLKILLIGAVLAFAKGAAGLIGFIFLPFAIFALDMMQCSRLHYILQRWEPLVEHVVPRLRDELGTPPFQFFEEDVIARKKMRFYRGLEENIRTFVFIPMVIVSAGAVAFMMRFTGAIPIWAILIGIGLWLTLPCALTLVFKDVYHERLVIGCSLGLMIMAVLDAYIFKQFSFLDTVEKLITN